MPPVSVSAARLVRARRPASTRLPSRTKSWPCTMTRAPSGTPASHIEALVVLDDGRRTKPTLPSRIDRAHADVARGRNHQRRARHPRRRHRRQRNADLRRDAVGDGAVGVGQFDLDPIGAGGRRRGLGDIADAALAGLPGHELDLGRVADLDAGDLALRHLDHRQHRIEADDLGDLLAGEGEGRRADLGNFGDDAVPGRRDDAAVALGFGGRERGLGGLVLRLQHVRDRAAGWRWSQSAAAWPRARPLR